MAAVGGGANVGRGVVCTRRANQISCEILDGRFNSVQWKF